MHASPTSRKTPHQPRKVAKKSATKPTKRRFTKARPRKYKQGSKKKSRGGTRTALDYCEMMHRIFAEQDNDPNPLRKFITVEELARMFELNKATIKRYLRFMRTRLHLPVAGIRARGGQGYTEKVHAFPLHTLTQGDMFLFVVAKGALGKGSPFEHKFPPLCAKVERALQGDEVNLKALESIVHFHDAGFDARVFADPQLWDFLASAIMDCREIEFDHLKAEPGATPTHRVIMPLSLHEIGRAWYVWCPDDDRPGEFKKFALSRMDRVERTGVTFKPIKFDPVAYLKGIGAFTGGPAEHVHLHITRKAAHLVPERPIHPTQKVTVRPDGSIDVTLFVAHTPELENWINLLAGNVEVLAPLSLRDVIHQQQAAGAALNRGVPKSATPDPETDFGNAAA